MSKWLLTVSQLDMSRAQIHLARGIVQRHRQIYPGSQLEMATGWQGPKTILDDDGLHPIKEAIRVMIGRQFQSLTLVSLLGWGNIMEEGDMIAWHDHKAPLTLVSGVYFLSDGGGDLALQCSMGISPLTDRIVLFHPELAHGVWASGHRTTIAFNAYVNPQIKGVPA